MSANPLLERLGYSSNDRLVIFHADDVGMCHGSNVAFLELFREGLVTCGSVMAPCGWSQEILAAGAADASLDLGVHITLNSEWPGYRSGSVEHARDAASGLMDEEGWFWPRPPALLAHMDAAAAKREMAVQVEHIGCANVHFSHIDAHMGAAQSAPLLEAYVELGFTHNVPVLLLREMDAYVESLAVASVGLDRYLALVEATQARGMPLVDRFRITPGYDGNEDGGKAEYYERTLGDLEAGITYFSLHPNAPGDIEVLTPKAHWRTFEYEYFRSERLRTFLDREGIIPISYRAICELMRA